MVSGLTVSMALHYICLARTVVFKVEKKNIVSTLSIVMFYYFVLVFAIRRFKH